jgi:predicted permease
MTLPSGIRRLFRLPPSPRTAAHAVDDELRFHLESRVQELVARGATPADAGRTAAREFGDLAAARVELTAIDRDRLARTARAEWWEGWWQDLRFAARALRRRPGFTAAALLTLALGLGVTGAVFAVADAALLRPLPYAAPDQLVHVWRTAASEPDAKGDLSYPELLDLRERARTLAGVAGYHSNRVVLGVADRPRVLWAGKTSANFFSLLGVRPAAGRFFAEGEDAPGAGRVAVLSHGLWQRQYGGDPSVVGRAVQLDGAPYTVVGVLPADFQFAPVGAADVWVPFDRPASWRASRTMSWFRAFARLRAGATPEEAAREVRAVAAALSREHAESAAERGMRLTPLRDEITGPVRPVLMTLVVAASLVLAVALANVANLLLVRGTARGRELGVRAALGAGNGRLARQLLTEGVVLALLGGTLGLGLAHAGARALLAAIPPERMRTMPYLHDVGGWRLAAGTLGVALLAGAAFGALSAARLVRPRLAEALRQGRGLSDGAQGGRLRDGLVAAELGLTVVLLAGAALLGRSLAQLVALDPGFRAERVATAFIPLPRVAYASGAARVAFFGGVEERVRALPGVEAVGLTTKLPLDPGNSSSYQVTGEPEPPPGRAPSANFRSVSRDYFRAMGIPLVRGATFPERADSAAPRVVVVSASLAREAFGREDPVGRRLTLGASSVEPATVVGVVGDVTTGRLEDGAEPTYYLPFAQAPDASMRVVVRTRGDVAGLDAAIRGIVRELDPEVALYQVYPMESLVRQSESVFLRRFPLLLVGAFAGAALLLAVVGTHGVVSYTVAQRVRELGIRVALGAASRNVLALVVGHVARVAAAGIGAGLVLAVVLARAASGLLYGVRATDPATYVAVAATLALVAAAAAALPARRATRVDPAITLRGD